MHACLLQSYDTDQLATEVIIGKDNLYTHIRDNREGNNVASSDTADILNCQELRPFWLMWKDNHYYVGRGAYDVISKIVSLWGSKRYFQFVTTIATNAFGTSFANPFTQVPALAKT